MGRVVRQRIARSARTIELSSKSKNLFFLIHGYTGSPTDFNKLGNYLHKRFGANVKIIRLVGHGTTIEDLDGLNYGDFLHCAELELAKDVRRGMNIVIGGLSVGSLLAFDLAARYPVKGVMSSSAAYTYRFPLSMFRFLEPLIPKKHFKKPFTEYEKISREKSYNYPYVHTRAIKVISQGKKRLKRLWKRIFIPCILIHCDWDRFFRSKSNADIIEQLSSKQAKNIVFRTNKGEEHNLFHSPYHVQVYRLFGDFVEKNKLLVKHG